MPIYVLAPYLLILINKNSLFRSKIYFLLARHGHEKYLDKFGTRICKGFAVMQYTITLLTV